MHKSIKVLETEVTRVGSLINWVRPCMAKMSIRMEEICAFSPGNKLQLTSPSIYNSLFSASILAITFSNSSKRSGGEVGGRYQVPARNGVHGTIRDYSPLLATIRHYSSLFATIRHYSPLFATIRHYSPLNSLLFATIRHYSSLFVIIRHYSSLFVTICHYSYYSLFSEPRE